MRNDPTSCTNCGSNDLIIDCRANDRVCRACGVIGRWVPPTQQTYHESSFNGAPLNDGDNLPRTLHHGALLNVARRADVWTGGYKHTRIRQLNSTLDELGSKLRCNERVIRTSKLQLRRILKLGTVPRVKKDELLCIVSICFAARKTTSPYSFRELAKVCSNVHKKEICRTFKQYERRLGKDERLDAMSLDYIPRITSTLGLPFRTERNIKMIVKAFEGYPNIRAMNPLTKIAVGVTIIHPKNELFIAKIAAVCGVSPHTLNKACHLACTEANTLQNAHTDWLGQ